jgi:phage terminase large subunit GpA-like protein
VRSAKALPLMAQQSLPADKVRLAIDRINAWRIDPQLSVACPVCEAPGLQILDQSARPYAEWYALSCPACGLTATINVPMSPHMPSGA